MRSYPKTPKILPWLAKKAGISESRAATLWHQAERWAEHRAKAGSSLYFKLAVDRLLQLEQLLLSHPRGLRTCPIAARLIPSGIANSSATGSMPARAQARFWALSMQAAQHGSALTDRGWRLIRSTSRLHQPG